jgi:cystathionine beta-lyase
MHWRSRLIHFDSKGPETFRSLSTPTYRGSTIVFPTQADVAETWQEAQSGYTYGLYGTPTARELAARIADLEGARHTFLASSGQAAIALINFAFASAGSHLLLPVNAYGPSKELARGLLRRSGIHVELYDPILGAGIANLIRPETALIWCESPGSITMEVPDLRAIVAAAHARNVPVALDNTYAAGVLLDAFSLGVDVSMQALTKYVGGHSDLLLGSVSVGTEDAYNRIGETHRALGMAVSPDDCSLALRGLQTMAVRLEALEQSTLKIANWLSTRPEIETILHPAFPSCPGHEFWKRDFTGSASIFSIVFQPRFTPQQVNAFVDALTLFKVGFSWGGVTSLALAYPTLHRSGKDYSGRIVRLNIGLEDTSDLIADLENALATLD